MEISQEWSDVGKDQKGRDPRKLHPVTSWLCLIFGFLLISAAIYWGGFRYACIADHVWGSLDESSLSRRTVTHSGPLSLPLLACLIIAAMISVLHVAFKWPFLSTDVQNVAVSQDREFYQKLHPAPSFQEDEPHNTARECCHGDSLKDKSLGDGDVNFSAVDNLEGVVSDEQEQVTLTVDNEKSADDESMALLTYENQSALVADESALEVNDVIQTFEEVVISDDENINLIDLDESQTVERNSCQSNAADMCPKCAEEHNDVCHAGTQTAEDTGRCDMATVSTMTCNPGLVDVSVNTHQRLCKIVKHCGTSTSGPFMKKLRRAQRLLSEASAKTKLEKQEKVFKWRAVMGRYKEKLCKLFDSLEKKDELLGYTALSRTLSENEVKEICTAVRSSRDRLLTQCKLNSALKEVIESKSEVPPPTLDSPSQQQAYR
ncbi:hypothetical protein BgiMline_000602 [Biomphalaria glabrata]|nr:hypothetical protein BgiMline_000554 [Biomphalaria glabrata]